MVSEKFPGISGRQVTVEIGENVRISTTAKFGSGVTIGNNVIIRAHSHIGTKSRIEDNTVVGERAALGEHVYLLDASSVGARSSIGAKSRIESCDIGERVKIGTGAKCQYATIENDVTIGNGFVGLGWFKTTSLVIRPQVVIGDSVHFDGDIVIGDNRASAKIVVGDGTRVQTKFGGQFIIASGVRIGRRCVIESGVRGGALGLSVTIGDNVQLCGVFVHDGAHVGSGTEVTDAIVGKRAIIGKRVIVSPTANIPENWRIADGMIANPNPDRKAGYPILIAGTPPRT